MKKKVILGVIFLIFLMVFQSTADEVADGMNLSEDRWNGTWESEYYTLVIQQDGPSILGSYIPFDTYANDPGRISGSLSDDGKIFSGKWIDSGTYILNLSYDEMSFSGIATIDPVKGAESIQHEFSANRSGEKDPDNPWTADWITPRKTYRFIQNGTNITGLTIPMEGTEDETGTVEGISSEDGKSVLLNWTESGNLSITSSDDGLFLNSTDTIVISRSNDTSYWNMTKVQ